MVKYNIKSRISKTRELHKTFRIFCGWKTEKIYFDALQKDYPNIRIETKLHWKAWINLIEFTKKEVKKIKRDKLDLIFIIFDRDEWNNTREQLEHVISEAIDNNIEPIISNKSFEVWLLMHFEKFLKLVSSVEEYEKILTKHFWKEYNKTDIEIYSKTKANLNWAIKNSKKVEEYHQESSVDNVRFCEPYTEVYKLLEKIIQA
jgi:hypothetical protein